MSLAWSNVLAMVAALLLPIVGGIWVAPKLPVAARRSFFALNLWGAPFVVGQFAQEDEWGSLWFQYHFLDLCYAPWGTALLMCLIPAGAAMLGRDAPEKLFVVCLVLTLGFGYATEVWDTAWALHGGASFIGALDMNDYTVLTAGAVAAVAFHLTVAFRLRVQQPLPKEATS